MARDTTRRHATPEERTFFESLLRLRTTYGQRDVADAKPVMSLHHALAAANAAMVEAVHSPVMRLGLAAN